MRPFRNALFDMLSGALVAQYEKFFTHREEIFYLVLVALLIFIASISAGIFSLGGITRLVELQEAADTSASRSNTQSRIKHRSKNPFRRITDSGAARCARWQQGLFLLGLVFFILIAIGDRATAKCPASRAPECAVLLLE